MRCSSREGEMSDVWSVDRIQVSRFEKAGILRLTLRRCDDSWEMFDCVERIYPGHGMAKPLARATASLRLPESRILPVKDVRFVTRCLVASGLGDCSPVHAFRAVFVQSVRQSKRKYGIQVTWTSHYRINPLAQPKKLSVQGGEILK